MSALKISILPGATLLIDSKSLVNVVIVNIFGLVVPEYESRNGLARLRVEGCEDDAQWYLNYVDYLGKDQLKIIKKVELVEADSRIEFKQNSFL